jgi:hypothetical protein
MKTPEGEEQAMVEAKNNEARISGTSSSFKVYTVQQP